MPAIAHLIKLILLLAQVPLYIKAISKKKKTIKSIGLRDFKRKSFIILKKLYRFKSIGKLPLFNRISNFKIGVYKGHKVGMFKYNNSIVIIISMKNKLPKFLLRPKSFRYALMRWLHKKKEVQTFSYNSTSSFVLLAEDKDKFTVATHFNSQVIRYFSYTEDIWVESDGYNLLIYKKNEFLYDGSKLDGVLTRAVEIKNILGAGES